MVRRVCLVSGGTGGHLLPAVTLARALREAGDQIVLLTEGRPAERVLLDRLPCRAEALAVGAAGPGLPLRLLAAAVRARRLLWRERIDVVVGTGGRTSIPVGIAARSLGLPVALMEQNAVTGRANRLLARLAARIYLGLPQAAAPRRGVLTGTPVRPELGAVDRADARRSLGLRDGIPVVLVTGGSQGAQVLNDIVPRGLCALRRPLQVLHLCGFGGLETAAALYARGADHGLSARVRAHTSDMATFFAAADLVICRGGGCTIAELATAGRPAIIVPYPHHRDRQQLWNGRVLADAGAALLVEQHRLDAPLVARTVAELLEPGVLRAMSARAGTLARLDTCRAIIEDLHALAPGSRW